MADRRKIIWSPKSADNLQSICTYIEKDSFYYASQFAKRLIALIENLPDYPERGRIVPEYNNPDLRELLYQNYRIVYRLKADVIEIVLITHSARLIQNILKNVTSD
jgi:plasmid stabilization system protein ParE